MLGVPVHQADIDHGAWSSRPGEPHAQPPNLYWQVSRSVGS
jgi:hypothetical protein